MAILGAETRVVPIRCGHVHVYLILTDDTAVLVDCGLPISLKTVRKAVLSAGSELGNIGLILLTHGHYDHTGAAAALKKASGAEILCSRAETAHLRAGRTPFPRGLNPYARLVSGLASRSMGEREQFAPVEPTIEIEGSYPLDRFGIQGRALPTPGHSAGSISLLLDSGEAFVGDACFNIFPLSVVPPLADDPAQLVESWRILLDSGAERFYPGHGKPFTREKLKRSMPKLERIVARRKQ